MNIAARQELMQVLAEISRLMPYMRLGQLVCHLTDMAEVPYQNAVAEVEDVEMLPAAKEFLEDIQRLPPEHLEAQIRAHLESEMRAAG